MLLSRVLRMGETFPLPVHGQVVMTTGNAGGTELVLDGVSLGAFGADGAVRKDVVLDADVIRDSKTIPLIPLAATVPGKPLPGRPQ
jgi:cytoskeleton protein RodZ